MNNPRDKIRTYDLEQLRSLEEFIQELITEKQNQIKRTVWRVSDSFGFVHKNFREEEYQKAADYVPEVARKIDSQPDLSPREREIRIIGERFPESEYEDFFNG